MGYHIIENDPTRATTGRTPETLTPDPQMSVRGSDPTAHLSDDGSAAIRSEMRRSFVRTREEYRAAAVERFIERVFVRCIYSSRIRPWTGWIPSDCSPLFPREVSRQRGMGQRAAARVTNS